MKYECANEMWHVVLLIGVLVTCTVVVTPLVPLPSPPLVTVEQGQTGDWGRLSARCSCCTPLSGLESSHLSQPHSLTCSQEDRADDQGGDQHVLGGHHGADRGPGEGGETWLGLFVDWSCLTDSDCVSLGRTSPLLATLHCCNLPSGPHCTTHRTYSHTPSLLHTGIYINQLN